jgi:hypothetical protein
MVDPRAEAEDIGYIRQRGLAVILGSATAVAVAAYKPYFGLYALISIPLWRLVLIRLAK